MNRRFNFCMTILFLTIFSLETYAQRRSGGSRSSGSSSRSSGNSGSSTRSAPSRSSGSSSRSSGSSSRSSGSSSRSSGSSSRSSGSTRSTPPSRSSGSTTRRSPSRSTPPPRSGSTTRKPTPRTGSTTRKPAPRTGSTTRKPTPRTGSTTRKPEPRTGSTTRTPRTGSTSRKPTPRTGSTTRAPRTGSTRSPRTTTMKPSKPTPSRVQRGDTRRDRARERERANAGRGQIQRQPRSAASRHRPHNAFRPHAHDHYYRRPDLRKYNRGIARSRLQFYGYYNYFNPYVHNYYRPFYYGNWFFWYTNSTSLYVYHNSVRFINWHGSLHNYSTYRTCNYQLVDSCYGGVVKSFWRTRCDISYDRCAETRNHYNYQEGERRYLCAETRYGEVSNATYRKIARKGKYLTCDGRGNPEQDYDYGQEYIEFNDQNDDYFSSGNFSDDNEYDDVYADDEY